MPWRRASKRTRSISYTATILAVGLRHAGRLEDAEAELRKVLELDENFPLAVGTLGAVCAQQGRFEEALTLTERAYALTPWAQSDRRTARGAPAFAPAPRAGPSALLERLSRARHAELPTGMAVFHAMCGEFDRAAESAERRDR